MISARYLTQGSFTVRQQFGICGLNWLWVMWQSCDAWIAVCIPLEQAFPWKEQLKETLLPDACVPSLSKTQGWNSERQWMGIYVCTVDPWLTDGSTYRLFKLQTSLAAKFRFDLQPENQPTDQKKTKMEQKRLVTGLIGFQCIVGQWRLGLQTFWPAPTVPIRVNSVNRGSTVHILFPMIQENLFNGFWCYEGSKFFLWPNGGFPSGNHGFPLRTVMFRDAVWSQS